MSREDAGAGAADAPAWRRARRCAVGNLGLAVFWCTLGAVVTGMGFPWSSKQLFANVLHPLLAALAVAGCVTLFASGLLLDRRRAARDPRLRGPFGLALAGGLAATLGSWGITAPYAVETYVAGVATPVLTGSHAADLALEIVFGALPLAWGAVNWLVWVRGRAVYESLAQADPAP